jgi:hypothetical protein
VSGVLQEIEAKIVATVHDLVAEAAAHEPEIEAAVSVALTEAGAPPEVAAALGALVKLLKAHFAADKAAQAPPEPDPQPEPEPAASP